MSMIIFACALLVLCCIGAWILEIVRWNSGICPQTGHPWILFDNDSQGGRGYKSGEHVLWISYPFVDKAKA